MTIELEVVELPNGSVFVLMDRRRLDARIRRVERQIDAASTEEERETNRVAIEQMTEQSKAIRDRYSSHIRCRQYELRKFMFGEKIAAPQTGRPDAKLSVGTCFATA